MNIRKGKGDYRLPPMGQLVDVFRESCGAYFTLMLVRPELLAQWRAKTPRVRGKPVYAAIIGRNHTLSIYPAPDADGELKLRYFPPMVEA